MRKISSIMAIMLLLIACSPNESIKQDVINQNLIIYNDLTEDDAFELWNKLNGYWVQLPQFYDTYIHIFTKDKQLYISFGKFNDDIHIEDTKIISISMIEDEEYIINIEYNRPNYDEVTNIDISINTKHLAGGSTLSIKFAANELLLGEINDNYIYMECQFSEDYQSAYQSWKENN